MYGEKVEEAEELRLDLSDVKEMYKTQIQELLQAGGSWKRGTTWKQIRMLLKGNKEGHRQGRTDLWSRKEEKVIKAPADQWKKLSWQNR